MALLIGISLFYIPPKIFHPKFLKLFYRRIYRVLPVLILLLLYFFQSDLKLSFDSFHRVLFNRSAGIQVTKPIARYIRKNTDPEDKVLVWGGEPGISYMAQRESPVAQIMFPLYVESPITAELVDRFLKEINMTKPELIIEEIIEFPSGVTPIDHLRRQVQLSSDRWISRESARLDEFYAFFDSYYAAEAVVDNYAIYRLIKNNP